MSKIITNAKAKETKDLTFNVVEQLAEISKRGDRACVRLDYASWGDGDPKYELRIWKEKDGVMIPTKGIGLTGEELIALRDKLNEMEAE